MVNKEKNLICSEKNFFWKKSPRLFPQIGQLYMHAKGRGVNVKYCLIMIFFRHWSNRNISIFIQVWQVLYGPSVSTFSAFVTVKKFAFFCPFLCNKWYFLSQPTNGFIINFWSFPVLFFKFVVFDATEKCYKHTVMPSCIIENIYFPTKLIFRSLGFHSFHLFLQITRPMNGRL